MGRRYLQLEAGDVLIVRERLPRVNPRPASTLPQWRYRVRVHSGSHPQRTFMSFAHAASEAERLASEHRARLMFIEDDVPLLLVDHRGR